MTSALNTALTGTVKPGTDSCASPVVSGRDRPPAAFTMDVGTRMLIAPATPYAALPLEQQHRITRAMGTLRWWWEQDHSHTIARHLFNIAEYATGGMMELRRVPSQCWMCQRVIAGAMCSRCLSHVQSNGTEEERHGNE